MSNIIAEIDSTVCGPSIADWALGIGLGVILVIGLVFIVAGVIIRTRK